MDLAALMPFYLPSLLAWLQSGAASPSLQTLLQLFKIFKLVRLAKLVRHSTGLQAIAKTLTSSHRELALLTLLLCIAGLLFSSAAFFIESSCEGTG